MIIRQMCKPFVYTFKKKAQRWNLKKKIVKKEKYFKN